MDFDKYTTGEKLERYAFYWLLLLLLFSAAAMFLGARPLATLILGYSFSPLWSLLDLSWLISGAAAVYLTYMWHKNGKTVFSGERNETLSFWFALLAGYNMGLIVVLGQNIFLSVFMAPIFWYIAGALCLFSAYTLHKAYKANGEKLFANTSEENEVVKNLEENNIETNFSEGDTSVSGVEVSETNTEVTDKAEEN